MNVNMKRRRLSSADDGSGGQLWPYLDQLRPLSHMTRPGRRMSPRTGRVQFSPGRRFHHMCTSMLSYREHSRCTTRAPLTPISELLRRAMMLFMAMGPRGSKDLRSMMAPGIAADGCCSTNKDVSPATRACATPLKYTNPPPSTREDRAA